MEGGSGIKEGTVREVEIKAGRHLVEWCEEMAMAHVN